MTGWVLIAGLVIVAAMVLRVGAVPAGAAGPLPVGIAPTLPDPTWGQDNPYPISSRCWDVWEAVRAAGFTRDQALTMVAIAQAESGCDSAATCDSCVVGVEEYSVGAFQLNLLAHPQISEAEARNIWTAAQWAYEISAQGTNFRPWTVYRTGAYRRYTVA